MHNVGQKVAYFYNEKKTECFCCPGANCSDLWSTKNIKKRKMKKKMERKYVGVTLLQLWPFIQASHAELVLFYMGFFLSYNYPSGNG